MTCSFCSIVSLRKLISLSFSLRTLSRSETAESDGEGVWREKNKNNVSKDATKVQYSDTPYSIDAVDWYTQTMYQLTCYWLPLCQIKVKDKKTALYDSMHHTTLKVSIYDTLILSSYNVESINVSYNVVSITIVSCYLITLVFNVIWCNGT